MTQHLWTVEVDKGDGWTVEVSVPGEATARYWYAASAAEDALVGTTRGARLLDPSGAVVASACRRCRFCGKTDTWVFLRSPITWLSTPHGPVCSADCGAKLTAREADPVRAPDWLDASWSFAPLTELPGWRVIEPWWAVGPAGHVVLELDASIGAGWVLIRRGRGRAGPFATWQEAVRA